MHESPRDTRLERKLRRNVKRTPCISGPRLRPSGSLGARKGRNAGNAVAGGRRGGTRGGSRRLTNYTRSTRFTGDALSETIVHPRSLLYLFTPPLGRLCPLVNRPSSTGFSASPFVPRGPREKDGRTRRSREHMRTRGRWSSIRREKTEECRSTKGNPVPIG